MTRVAARQFRGWRFPKLYARLVCYVFSGKKSARVSDRADVLHIGFDGFSEEGLLECEHVYPLSVRELRVHGGRGEEVPSRFENL